MSAFSTLVVAMAHLKVLWSWPIGHSGHACVCASEIMDIHMLQAYNILHY